MHCWYHHCERNVAGALATTLRIRIIQTPSLSSIDGIDLRQYHSGFEYEVGTTIGSLLLLHRWAELVIEGKPAPGVPVVDTEKSTNRSPNPPNLRREYSGAPGVHRADTVSRERRARRSTRKPGR